MILLVDANSVCHQMKHAMGDLSWEEKRVGVLFGFLRQLLSLAKILKSNRFVFAWDTRSSVRSKFFPEYKGRRKKDKTPEEKELDDIAYIQFNTLQHEILPEIGFLNSFWQEGYEADDIMASIVHCNPKEKIVIISTDEDLYQLLSENVTMYSIRKKQEYTHHNLWKDYHVPPQDWIDVKSIAGCSSDDIPGVVGVGEKTACKYLNRQLSVVHKTYRSIKDSEELIKRNLQLVTLPYSGTEEIPITNENALSLKGFLNVCTRYGFESFMSKDNLNQWKEHIFYKDEDHGTSSY
jgi:DNA polymerase-1